MKRVLILGGCGYVGARVAKSLAASNYTVTVFCRSIPKGNPDWVNGMHSIVAGDIRDDSAMHKLAKQSYDIVLNLVSLDHRESEAEAGVINAINVLPSWKLLDALTKNQNTERFIYFSTQQVYGHIPSTEIDEDFPLKPKNKYGLTHQLTEDIINYYHNNYDLDCINVRLSNAYGSPVFEENRCWWLVINDLCRSAYINKEIKLLSDGSPQRDFVHLVDVCQAIRLLIECKNIASNNTYNVASGETLTIYDLAKAVQQTFFERYNTKIPIHLPENVTLPKDDPIQKFSIDISSLRNLGFQKKVILPEGLLEIFSYLEKRHAIQ